MSTHPKDSSSAAHSHPRPRLVLRVAFAGRRELSPQEHTRLKSALLDVLHTLGHRLAAIAPGIPVDTGNEPRVSKFYEATCPLLRLVTGLCEGADALAGEVLKKVTIHPDPKAGARDTRCLETELAAVLPCDIETYRQSRDPSFHAEFDQQLKRCAWVLELDGKCHKPEPDTPRDKTCRQRAYRAQSAFLLRHCDLLIAAANPDEPGKAGGTLETIQAALAFDLPVILIHTGKDSGNIHPISPENDLHAKLEEPPALPEKCREIISRWVSEIAVDPDSGLSPDEQKKAEGADEGEALLHEYFDETAMPGREAQKPLARFRKWAWDRFEKFFRSGPVPKSDPPLSPYSHYRSRATSLNYHYSAQYRGAFLLNYLFAIVTVTLAAISLALLAQTIGHGEGGFWAAAPPRWLPFVLLALAVSKLLLLTFISKNTRRANQEKWNDRAIDYRYLAERLRGMYYLPRAGSQQPPAAMPLQFASRAVRQSAIDWLFDALVRAISPADLEIAHTREVPSHDKSR